jgi:hypothetical protein
MMILCEIGVDLKPLLAAAGLGGLAIGFGAQSLVKDLISGFLSSWKIPSGWGMWLRSRGWQGLSKKSSCEP